MTCSKTFCFFWWYLYCSVHHHTQLKEHIYQKPFHVYCNGVSFNHNSIVINCIFHAWANAMSSRSTKIASSTTIKQFYIGFMSYSTTVTFLSVTKLLWLLYNVWSETKWIHAKNASSHFVRNTIFLFVLRNSLLFIARSDHRMVKDWML